MNSPNIIQQRLRNQRISATPFNRAAEVVKWLGAVQAQDYAGAKWALGLRTQAATEIEIEASFNAGEILRTHILRPTWHFVLPADIRWMLALTAPRVHARNAHIYSKAGLNTAAFDRSNNILLKALEGGKQHTRDELRAALCEGGVETEGEYRMNYILMQAELEALICSGPRRGKQFTYALLDERVPLGKTLDRESALAELTRRYFISRGPASVHDFSKWSGLTIADARLGVEFVKDELEQTEVEGKTYWYPPPGNMAEQVYPQAHLLSIYDEYISSYKGLTFVASPEDARNLLDLGTALSYILLMNGRIVAKWKREIRKSDVLISMQLFKGLAEAEEQALTSEVYRFGEFLGLSALLKMA